MEKFEKRFIKFIDNITEPLSRFSFFIVYFWFGTLKILGLSSATPLVKDLFSCTLCKLGLDFTSFYPFFTLFEIIIGIMFLFPKLTKITTIFFFIHMYTTMLPLILLPQEVYDGFGILTMEGQYILKNVILISLALFLLKSNKDSKY